MLENVLLKVQINLSEEFRELKCSRTLVRLDEDQGNQIMVPDVLQLSLI
jgi:hypothetical protein